MTDRMLGFAGIPAGRLATTPIPSLLFGELFPLIDNLIELKVTLHMFWLVGRKRTRLRYARLGELRADERLLQGLADGTDAAQERLLEGLERAVVRGTLLHATVDRGEAIEEWYMINAPHGREVMEKLRAGELDLLSDVAEDVQLQVERPNVFVLYEQNIGLLTPMIADELRDAERTYPANWIVDAFREGVSLNKRNWRYILRILQRWQVEGKDAVRSAGDAPSDAEARQRYYVPEGYEDLIEH